MTKEEIKEYLKRVEELELKLEGEDKETLQWLIYGYNKCAKLLYEAEQENGKLNEIKEVIDMYNIGKYDYNIPPNGIDAILQIIDR